MALIAGEPRADDASSLVEESAEQVLSDFASAEVASAISQAVRTGRVSAAAARSLHVALDDLLLRLGGRRSLHRDDVREAERFLRRLDLPLRAPDALHISMALRLGATLATFDVRLAESARRLDCRVKGC